MMASGCRLWILRSTLSIAQDPGICLRMNHGAMCCATKRNSSGKILQLQLRDARDHLWRVNSILAPAAWWLHMSVFAPMGGSRLFRIEHRHLWCGARKAKFRPTFPHVIVHGSAQQRGLRKTFQMLVRLTGIDQHLRTVRPHLDREAAGIKSRRPGVAQDVDVFGGM